MCLIAQTHTPYFYAIYNLNLQLFLSENITGSLFSTGRYPIDIIEIQKEMSGRQKQTSGGQKETSGGQKEVSGG
jgi:hypothetical protein